MLFQHGGPFDIARVVDLGRPIPQPKPPHVEDHLFDPSHADGSETMDAETFWAVLTGVCRNQLVEIFGSALRQAKNSSACCTNLGQGTASLGCLLPRRKPVLYCDSPSPRSPKPRIRICIDDGQWKAWVPVTDLRLFQRDYETPDPARVELFRRRLQGPGAVILAIGLTRAFASTAEPEPVHWLQVNNIHLETGL